MLPSRRHVIEAGGATALAAALVPGCDQLSSAPGRGPGASKGGADGGAEESAGSPVKESPALADRVRAGRLPPLEHRLPQTPLVVEPVRSPGTYGGTWRSAIYGPADTGWMMTKVHYDHLVSWNVEWTAVIPNIARSVDIEGDGRRYTFHLRPGMRWSDGEPFTAADVVFAVEDVLLNEDLYPIPPDWLVAGGPPRMESPDSYTVRFVFERPNGLFLENIAMPQGSALTNQPRHYLERFHATYNKAADDLARKARLQGWPSLYLAKSTEWENPRVPTLCAWVFTTAIGKGTRMVLDRNPYYWKTDPDGRQLPYIDQVAFNVVNDEEVVLLMASHGDIGMETAQINTLRNKPVLARNREGGNYDFFEMQPAKMNEIILALNLTHKDPVLRAIFRNRDFRVGLSYAINRPELIKTVMQGQGEPWQAGPREKSGFYDEALATQYTRFDVGEANGHLDRAGYAERDAQGRRLRPDGLPIRFSVEVSLGVRQADLWSSAVTIIKRYWAHVGIDIELKNEDRALFTERKTANSHDANVWGGDGGLKDAVLEPIWYFPFSEGSNFAIPWAAWFTSRGKEGQEPPAAAKRQMALYRELAATTDLDKRESYLGQILRIAKEQFWVIGITLPTQGYGVVSNTFHNVPDTIFDSWQYATPGPTRPEQYFIAEGQP